MSSNEHIALRQVFYEAWGAYHEASGLFWAAIPPNRGPEETGRLVVAVRTLAAVLDDALAALQGYLEQQEQSERDTEEHTRMSRIRELLVHELSLLPKAE
jgi:hypothetical protein